MSEAINNVTKRKEALKVVIQRLHAGESVEDLQQEFGKVIRGATASEIAEAERALISEGVPVGDIQRLCDLHVAVFRQALDKEPPPESLPGHPVFTFRMENEVTARLLEAMTEKLASWKEGDHSALESLQLQAQNLSTIEKHYSRKENLLFPYLEMKGFEGPSTVMWGVENEIRAQIKQFTQAINASKPELEAVRSKFTRLAETIQEMIYKEEKILFPEALQKISDQEWAEIRQQEEEISYFNITPRDAWKPKPNNKTEKEGTMEKQEMKEHEGLLSLDTGALSQEQINLMLTHLPVDVTYVDENDRVRYFSKGRERIFHRSPAIIGREVTRCHPPQSVHRVQIILDDFRSGKRNLAEFWIQMGEQLIHIRYFALYDTDGAYKGCIEVSQNVTHIRALQGEKRLLDDVPGYDQ